MRLVIKISLKKYDEIEAIFPDVNCRRGDYARVLWYMWKPILQIDTSAWKFIFKRLNHEFFFEDLKNEVYQESIK